MKQTINEYQFKRAFETTRPNYFSYEGLTALYEYLKEYEEGTGEEVELDVVGLCCDYTEYEDLEEFQIILEQNQKQEKKWMIGTWRWDLMVGGHVDF